MITLNDHQSKIKKIVDEFDFRWSLYVQYIHLIEETAELGEAITVYKGDRKAGSGEAALADHADLKEEIGDLLFSILAIANELNINTEQALKLAYSRYKRKLNKLMISRKITC